MISQDASKLIATIYDCVENPETWQHLSEVFYHSFHTSGVLHIGQSYDAKEIHLSHCHGIDTRWCREYVKNWLPHTRRDSK